MVKYNSFEINSIVEDAWNILDEQIKNVKSLNAKLHEDIENGKADVNQLLSDYYNKIAEIKELDKIRKFTEFPEPYLAHYYVYFAHGLVFLRGIGDWLSENEMIIKRTKGSFDDRYQSDPTYDKWKDDDDNFFTSDKFTYKRLAWGERCDKIFEPDFLVTIKKISW